MNYKDSAAAKAAILEVGRRLYQRGYVCANDGNISARMEDGTVWMTPTGVSKGFMTEDMLVRMSPDGEVLEGTWPVTSESAMHLAIYRERPDVGGIVHAHPAATVAYAAQGKPFDLAISLDAALQVGYVPCAPYATTGSPELAESAARFCRDANVTLLEHHGALAWGRDAIAALYRMECLEQTFVVYEHMRAMGEVRLLSKQELKDLEPVRRKLGMSLEHPLRTRD